MKRLAVLVCIACLAVGFPARSGFAGGAKARTWKRAAAMAKAQNRIIFAIYSEGSAREARVDDLFPTRMGGGPTVAQADEEFQGAPNISQTLRHVKVRQITSKHCIVASLRMGDPGSMWDEFKVHSSDGGEHERCIFATWKGEFLNILSDRARPRDFIEAWNVAFDRYKEILKADPEYQKMMQEKRELAARKELVKEAELATRKGDYPKAIAKVNQVLELTTDTTGEGRRAKSIRRQMAAMAKAGLNRAEVRLKQDKPLDAFRELDDVAHLFKGLKEADEAEKRLAELMAQATLAEAAARYRPERRAYDLWDEAWRLQQNERWKEALEKYSKVIDEFLDSLVAKRASRWAKVCQIEVKKEEAKAEAEAKKAAAAEKGSQPDAQTTDTGGQ